MPSPILARADALMHRKRQTEVDSDDVPVLTDAVDDDDDIPVLLEAEPSISAAAPPIPDVETAALETEGISALAAPAEEEPVPTDISTSAESTLDATLREHMASELARRVELRLAAELPRIIESTLRDFLAEQEMIAAASPRD